MKEIIEDLLEKKKIRYKADYNEMLGDYKREQETTEGYSGRQILELLQNCDDEQAKEVLISLDTLNKTISISNSGEPFSEKGYRSLFIANLSSKTSKRKYIGNKGLGFRSVLNWSNKIEILSNGLILTYSHENLRDVYETLFTENMRLQIAEEEGLNIDVVPIPILSIPTINEAEGNVNFATTITIYYKEGFFNDIINQLNSLSSDILLFLRNIETIKFNGLADKKDISCLRENVEIDTQDIHRQQNLILNDRNWTVYSWEDELPDELMNKDKKEKDLYQISIAIEENMSHSVPYLYSFFPTNIKLNQPYVLHATFDLDSTRNQINRTEKNIFIFKKIIDFTISVAKYLSKAKVSYTPLKILYHKDKVDTLSKFSYYNLIDKAIEEQSLFPSVHNTYITKAESLFISNDMANLLLEIGAQKLLDVHLLSTTDELILKLLDQYNIDNKFSVLQDCQGVINSIATLQISNLNRAKLIKIVTQNFLNESSKPKRLKLLIDTEEKIINEDEDIYTPSTNDNRLLIPSFANIKFINNNLFESILSCYKKESYERRGKARFVYDLLKDHCNVHSFEPITLAEKIIRISNELLKKENEEEEKVKIIQEMNQCLYHNYKTQTDKTKLNIHNVPSITKSNSIQNLSALHLSAHYPIGKNVELIFENVYTSEDYVAEAATLGLFKESSENIESFLLWLGVNSYFKFTDKLEHKRFVSGNSLCDHPFLSYTKKFRNDNNYYTGYTLNYLDIQDLDRIFKLLDINKIIILAFIDPVFRKQVNNQDKVDLINLFYRYDIPVLNTPSYIKYRIVSKYKTEDYLLDEKFSWINDYEINYDYPLFKEFGLNRIRVNEILLNFGAIDSFNKLNIAKLTDAFEKLNHHFPNGKGSQQFYKKSINHYEENGLKPTRKIRLFANINNKLNVFDQNQIYFSDNNFLPSSLSTDYPIFNFPLRAGAKRAIEFFGINDLGLLQVYLEKFELNNSIQLGFDVFFRTVMPYFLAYRLEKIEKSNVKEDQVLRLKNFKFRFCVEVFGKIKSDEFALNDYNYLYIAKEKVYYIKVPYSESVDSLRQNPLFVDNFSEILLNVFATTSEKPQFESILRDNIETINYNIKKTLGDNALEESKALLGLIDSKTVFWDVIFQLKNIPISEGIVDTENKLNELIGNQQILIDFEDINSSKNLQNIHNLFTKLNIRVEDFNVLSLSKLNTFDYNLRRLNNHISGMEIKIKQLIWNFLSTKKDQQKNIIKYFNTTDLVKNEYANIHEMLNSNFDIDYENVNISLLIKFIDFIDFRENPIEISFTELYKNNKLIFSEEEIVIIENHPEIHSLLYFEDIEPVINFLSSLKTLESSNNLNKMLNDENIEKEIKYISYIRTRIKETGLKKSNIYNPLNQNSSHSKVIGNRAEELAYQNLVLQYGAENVIHKSKDSEWEHYDIKYSKDNGLNWIYVEVKSTSSNKFTLSLSEKEFGERNSYFYEIWIFKDDIFIVLTDFFSGSPILNPLEYEVIFEDN